MARQINRDHIEMRGEQGDEISKGVRRGPRAVDEQTNRARTTALNMPTQAARLDKTTAIAIRPITTLDLPIWCAQNFGAQLPVSPLLR